jgi:hypothetical protein
MALDDVVKEWEKALKRAQRATLFAMIAVGMALVSALLNLWNLLRR